MHWLVQKLPRSREERAEEALGANAALNKRVLEHILAWKAFPFKLHICVKHIPPRNEYTVNRFQTLSVKDGLSANLLNLVKCSQNLKLDISPSLLEINALNSISETSSNLTEDIFGASDQKLARGKCSLCRTVKDSLKSSATLYSFESLSGQISESRPNSGLTFSVDFRDKNGIFSKNFQDLLDIFGSHDESCESERGTRFIHATKFSHETAILLEDSEKQFVQSSNMLDGVHNDSSNSESFVATTLKSGESSSFSSEVLLDTLRSEIQHDSSALECKKKEKSSYTLKIRQSENDLSASSTESDRLEREVILKRKVLELLPLANENIKKLQDICAVNANRLLELSHEWESHRRILLDRVRNPKGAKSERKLRCKKMVEEMKAFREMMQKMVSDLKDKQDYSQALKEELEKLPRNINRNMYTFRIMDIISQVTKQNKEIEKIISDIRDIQKATNQANSSLQRADAIAEEKIYAAANSLGSDPAMTDAYRHLRRLRATFEQLVVTVEKIGQEDKVARGLETKIEQEQARVSANNFERIQSDLELIKSENSQLILRLKSTNK